MIRLIFEFIARTLKMHRTMSCISKSEDVKGEIFKTDIDTFPTAGKRLTEIV